MLAWEPFEETTIENNRTEMLSNNLSGKKGFKMPVPKY